MGGELVYLGTVISCKSLPYTVWDEGDRVRHISLSPLSQAFPECAGSRRFAASHPQHRLRLRPASHLRPLLVHVVSSQEVTVLTLLSSPYCGTSAQTLHAHSLHFSSSPSLCFSHLYTSHIFLRLLHGTLSMERGHIQSIFRGLQNLALFAAFARVTKSAVEFSSLPLSNISCRSGFVRFL